jgi:speckle-type POZ protein
MSESTSSFKSLEFTWKITNYSQKKLGKRITSDFLVGPRGELRFTLEYYPQGDVQSDDTEVSDEEKWASIYLLTQSSKKYDTSHHVEFSILDVDGEKFGIRHFHGKIPINDGFLWFIRLTDIENPANHLLPNDTLTICCRVEETKSESEECKCQIEHPPTTNARRKLCEDLSSVLDEKYTDFVFKVKNVNFAAHRVILGARSPVFDAMFQHDMLENRTNETEITDVTTAAFKALLRFIYTGHCEVGYLA